MRGSISLNTWELSCLVLGVMLQVVLLSILLVKRRFAVFPWFTVLIAQYLAQSFILAFIHAYARPSTYFYAYWIGELIAASIRVGVVLELGRATALYVRWQDTRRMRLCVSIASVVAVGAWLLYEGRAVHDPLVRFATEFSFFTSFLTFILAVQFAHTTWILGLRVGVHSQAIGYGLMLFYASSTAGDFALLDGEASSWTAFQQILKPLYILCLAAWGYALWRPEPERIMSDPLRVIFEVPGVCRQRLIIRMGKALQTPGLTDRQPDLIRAHTHCIENRAEVELSALCGCFYCMSIYPSHEIADWIKDRKALTARCPRCGIDTVICSASGFPITCEFLNLMNEHWF